jgi:hypothetical protein
VWASQKGTYVDDKDSGSEEGHDHMDRPRITYTEVLRTGELKEG